MSKNILDAIDRTQHGDPGDCLREMLAEWLRGAGDPPRTWSTIVATLKKVDGLSALAEMIECKYNLVDNGSKAVSRDTPTQGNIQTSYVVVQTTIHTV